MPTHGSVGRVGVTLAIALGFALTTAAPASAMTVTHTVHVDQFDVHWTCPGHDPVEHATTTVRITEFWADGVRVRSITHWLWRGWLENRDTGELLRDDGSWTVVSLYGPSGNRVVRTTISGAVWRFTVPGEGIVVHQTGRAVYGDDEEFTSAFGGSADTSLLCAFV
ncbi:MAG: hypothetical protein M3O29_01460 [Actinomycetota bacterium]|nr:hypothetical protein [Actinomycetota bacterium]